MIASLKGLSYEERLRAFNLPSLEHRRRRGDMLQVYKTLNGIDRNAMWWCHSVVGGAHIGALKRMFLLSSTQQGSDPVFTFTTLLGIKPLTCVFGRAVHSLSKIGDELYIEPLEQGLSLRTVNSSRSAFACFVFSPSFFLHYDDGKTEDLSKPTTDHDDDDYDDSTIRCKIGMKSCLNVFKSLSTLEKTVEKCKININMQDARVIFQLYCRHGIMKTYNLAFIESETLQAVFSKDHTPNVLTTQSRLLCDAVTNFQTTQEEVSLIVNEDEVILKNYVEDEPDPNKIIHTQMRLNPEEFQVFQVGVNAEVTFCLKELRAVLHFSESANLPISIHFESPGKPIIFCLDSDPSFEANFVLATLADVSTQVSCSQRSTQTAQSKSKDSRNITAKKRQISSNNERSASKRHQDESNISASSFLSRNENIIKTKPREKTTNPTALQAATDHLLNYVELANDTKQSFSTNTETRETELRNNSQVLLTTSPRDSEEEESPRIPLQMHQQSTHQIISGFEEPEEQEEEVPGTPPHATQFKSLFFGLSQASSMASQQVRSPQTAHGEPMVLAEDTDDED
ncbi:hypothetical protein LSH36_15g16012 [Paralvinella palmiformis]|uniref:Cell cycle checkpoint control protein RAD9A n=1 Tax=Paralvinella palmiformis TaxID=53620 RepID=A0AAD9KCN8_9ANNE|nr:hypothetical protein LSH36_15g16012 [Paralvinella palmiformis]